MDQVKQRAIIRANILYWTRRAEKAGFLRRFFYFRRVKLLRQELDAVVEG